MASRIRKRFYRYGGEVLGQQRSFGVDSVPLTPLYLCQHTCSDETHPGPPYKTGGPLDITKKKVKIQRTGSFSVTYGANDFYSGAMAVLPYIPSPEPTPTNLSGWGAKGWNRTFPLHPVYNLGVSLIELKDVPRMISQSLRALKDLGTLEKKIGGIANFGQFVRDIGKGPKYLADHYLNYQFGWVPFAQDLSAVINYREKLAKKLAWLHRHNGKSVRRQVTLAEDGFSEAILRYVAPHTTMTPGFRTEIYADSVLTPEDMSIIKGFDRKIWFSAKYRFFIPELSDIKDQYRLGNHTRLKAELYGLAADPSIIYKVIPWTWLLGYFTDVGEVIQNVYFRSRYQVVAEYAYVMCRETFTYDAPGHTRVNTGTYGFMTPPPRFDFSGQPVKLGGVSRTTYEFRRREVANPYGFGLTYASLSAYQWSILAALGLSRGSKHSAPRT